MTARRCLVDLALVGLVFVVGGVALTAYAVYRIGEVGQHDNKRHVDAIVVLGAAQYNGRPSAVLAARLDHAIELYKDGYARYFVVTGGNLPGDRYTEASTEARYAQARGVPASAIIGEYTGGTTLESIQHVRALFDRYGLHTALFVSDRTHMLRVLRMASDQGIEAWGSPATDSPADTDPTMHFDALVHELGALAEYSFLESHQPAVTPAPSPSPSTAPSPSPGPTSPAP